MGGSDTPNHGRAAPGRPVDHVSLARPPRGRPTRSNNHGPRRTPDTASGLHARRAASQAAPVAPLPGRGQCVTPHPSRPRSVGRADAFSGEASLLQGKSTPWRARLV